MSHHISPSRRGFLQGFLALSVLAVAGPSLAALRPDDHARLLASAASGLVEFQHFLLPEPVLINIENLTLRHCVFHFDFSAPARYGIRFGLCEGLAVMASHFMVVPNSIAPDCLLHVGPSDVVIGGTATGQIFPESV